MTFLYINAIMYTSGSMPATFPARSTYMPFLTLFAIVVSIELATIVAVLATNGRNAESRFRWLCYTATAWVVVAVAALMVWTNSPAALESRPVGWLFAVDATINALLAVAWMRTAAIESELNERRRRRRK